MSDKWDWDEIERKREKAKQDALKLYRHLFGVNCSWDSDRFQSYTAFDPIDCLIVKPEIAELIERTFDKLNDHWNACGKDIRIDHAVIDSKKHPGRKSVIICYAHAEPVDGYPQEDRNDPVFPQKKLGYALLSEYLEQITTPTAAPRIQPLCPAGIKALKDQRNKFLGIVEKEELPSSSYIEKALRTGEDRVSLAKTEEGKKWSRGSLTSGSGWELN